MKDAIENFNTAQAKLKQVETALNKAVENEMQKCKTVDQLHDLVNSLPKNYKGSRRIYEQILRLTTYKDKDAPKQSN